MIAPYSLGADARSLRLGLRLSVDSASNPSGYGVYPRSGATVPDLRVY